MLQSLQSLTAQSTAQACALHTCVPDSVGHSAPPCATGTVMERARICEPPPHDLVHAPQPAHEPTAQSVGHACELQVRDSVRCAHCRPPSALGMATLRARVCEPPPQLTLQPPNAAKSVRTQSRGHACTLHARLSSSAGHALPLNWASISMLRWRVCEPPLHECEQVPHAPNDEVLQWMGHGDVLHSRSSSKAGHGSPLNCADTSMLRVRCAKPLPHSALQAP